MLLKGLQELQQDGVDKLAAAEMVLIRLAHVAELPTPGDLVKRLTDGSGAIAAGPAHPAPISARNARADQKPVVTQANPTNAAAVIATQPR